MVRLKSLMLPGLILSAWLLVSPPEITAQGASYMSFVGRETLQGYGRLEFRFEDLGEDGDVLMIDTAGRTRGRYRLNFETNRITMTFGDCVYTGTLRYAPRPSRNNQRDTISGTARVGNKAWQFSVMATR